MILLLSWILSNVVGVIVLIASSDNSNIESRTEREEQILKNYENGRKNIS